MGRDSPSIAEPQGSARRFLGARHPLSECTRCRVALRRTLARPPDDRFHADMCQPSNWFRDRRPWRAMTARAAAVWLCEAALAMETWSAECYEFPDDGPGRALNRNRIMLMQAAGTLTARDGREWTLEAPPTAGVSIWWPSTGPRSGLTSGWPNASADPATNRDKRPPVGAAPGSPVGNALSGQNFPSDSEPQGSARRFLGARHPLSECLLCRVALRRTLARPRRRPFSCGHCPPSNWFRDWRPWRAMAAAAHSFTAVSAPAPQSPVVVPEFCYEPGAGGRRCERC